MTEHKTVLKGLEGVYVTESGVSLIDTENGALYYAGYDLRELVEHSSFEEVMFLLIHKRLPLRQEFSEFRELIRRSMELEPIHIEAIHRYARIVDVLTLLVILISLKGTGRQGGDPRDVNSAVDIVAKMGSFLSTIVRIKEGGDYVPPRSDFSYAENLLNMMNGGNYEDEHVEILDDLLIIHADDGISASTFGARRRLHAKRYVLFSRGGYLGS